MTDAIPRPLREQIETTFEYLIAEMHVDPTRIMRVTQADLRRVLQAGINLGRSQGRADAWQPIATAPKDGMFLVADGTRQMVASGNILAASRREDTPFHLGGKHWTHWMPLPPSPSEGP